MAGPKRFNRYILKSIEAIAKHRANLGYDIHSYFTRNLDYGGKGIVRANHPPNTMCVAAVCEIIIEALNIWQLEHTINRVRPDRPFLDLPADSWNGTSRSNIRSYIFMYSGLKSRGTADALGRFGIGSETSFDQLQPGDFVNFNRSRSGHAVAFLGYLNNKYEVVSYSPSIVGFKYFSAQGKSAAAPNHGFGYRWGIFAGNRLGPPPPEVVVDTGIRRSRSLAVLDCGYMCDPSDWKISSAIAKLKNDFEKQVARQYDLRRRPSKEYASKNVARDVLLDLTTRLFNEPLAEPDWNQFDDSRR